MKKKIIFIIACFWFIISFLLIGATYSKYLTSFNASTNVGIEAWNIVVNNQNIMSNSNLSSNLSLVFPGSTYAKANYIVPGEIGYFDIIINTSSVTIPFKYTITAEPGTLNNIDDLEIIGFSLNGNNNTITYLDNTVTEISNNVYTDTVSSSIRVYVKWNDTNPQTLSDNDDTNIALDAASAVLDVTVDFEQIVQPTVVPSTP